MSFDKDIKRLGFKSAIRLAMSDFDLGRMKIDLPNQMAIYIRSSKSSDAKVVRQIFANREYFVKNKAFAAAIEKHYQDALKNGKTPVFMDLGANIGASSIFFSMQFPKAKIIAIEPDEENFKILSLNCENCENIIAYNYAIGGEAGFVQVNNDCEPWAVTTERAQSGLKIITINELLQLHPECALFGLKIDIEGFEDDLFSANLEWLANAKIIYLEPHDWMMPHKGTSLNFQKQMANCNMEFLISGENLIYVAMN